MKKIVIAPFCLQISLHKAQSRGKRLVDFFRLLKEVDSKLVIESPNKELCPKDLDECNLFISTTRLYKMPYREDDLDLIEKYVRAGGNLLLMSNHTTHTNEDSKLASRFGFRFDPTCFKSSQKDKQLTIEDCEPPPHSVLQFPDDSEKTLKLRSITVRI